MSGFINFMRFERIEERWTRMEQGDVSPNEMLRILGLAMDDVATLRGLVHELREENARLEDRNGALRGRLSQNVEDAS